MVDYFHVSNEVLESGRMLECKYGKVILNERYYSDSDHYHNQYLREIIFEEVRKSNFADKPSRLKSIYLFDEIRLALKYRNDLKKKYIYTVRIEDGSKLLRTDMNLINLSVGKSIDEIRSLASRYFSDCKKTDNTEVICEGSVSIENRMHIVEAYGMLFLLYSNG
ncbi:DUF2441 domain-containing protein [Oceanobacillus damuensis]|uniref:DUF2441 domain-containing protein n=1 Tax=Oceanobacillus damuensis TaxID=937928 RepID=UPI0008310E28|nr:DUF2441 domain-containing protein [Oceanobacillus damuensis]